MIEPMLTVKAIAAFAFVAVLAGVLTIPLRGPNATDDPLALASPVGSSPAPLDAGAADPKLVGRLPTQCRGQVRPPNNGGVIAAIRGRRLTLATPRGEILARLHAKAPIGWSASGRFLATGSGGALWYSDGSPVQRHHRYQLSLGRDLSGWAWSPVGDCGFVLDRKGNLFVTAVNPRKIPPTYSVMLASDVESFAVASDWRWLGLVLRDSNRRSLAIADLKRHRINIVRTYGRGTCCITLAGWSVEKQSFNFWAGPGDSVMADGWPLLAVPVPAGRPQSTDTTVLPDAPLVGDCAGSTAAVAGGNRDRRTNKRVRYVEARSARVTPRDLAVSSFTCSPEGTLVFSAADDGDDPVERKLYLIALGGDQRPSVLADDPERADDRPEWKPGIGILFVRWRGSKGAVWLIPEGGPPRRLRITVRTDPGAYWAGADWGRILDWSATPPTGLPTG